jgi:hypothetical protein
VAGQLGVGCYRLVAGETDGFLVVVHGSTAGLDARMVVILAGKAVCDEWAVRLVGVVGLL